MMPVIVCLSKSVPQTWQIIVQTLIFLIKNIFTYHIHLKKDKSLCEPMQTLQRGLGKKSLVHCLKFEPKTKLALINNYGCMKKDFE